MKNLKLIGFLMIMASSLMFIQCTSDPIAGPQGLAGADGINGTDGVNGVDGADGVDGTASCVACHSDSHRTPINESFAMSVHNTQNMMYTGQTVAEYTNRGGGAGCAACHVDQGYIDYMTTGAIAADPYLVADGVSCTTCHEKHSTFDFENDGHDFALRNFEPVTLEVDPNYTIDFGGTSNNCTFCHQPRTATPTSIDGTFTITSEHWGPHHGPQATLLEGIQGANIVGSTAYPTPQSATHRTGASCVSCHMGETTDGTDGAHTFAPTDNGCVACHTSGTPTEVNGLEADLETLATLLEEIGIVHEGHPVVGTYTILQTEAAWNYLFLMEDKSKGIHNPGYAKALIKNSIEALQ